MRLGKALATGSAEEREDRVPFPEEAPSPARQAAGGSGDAEETAGDEVPAAP